MKREIKDLRAYEKNPRKITKDDFATLQKSLVEFGDLSGVIFNRTTANLVGGHQRTNAFKSKNAVISLVEELDTASATGTIATGYIEVDGEKFAYREVEWDEVKEQRANILANKVSGQWDFDMLANAFGTDVLLDSGWKASELGFAVLPEDEKVDESMLDTSMDTYLAGNIKQIVLYFGSEEFEKIVPRLDKVMEQEGVGSHTEVLIKLLEHYESN